jgi:hypothetical protein
MENLAIQPDWTEGELDVIQVGPVTWPLSEEKFLTFQTHFHPFSAEENDSFSLILYYLNALNFCLQLA